jgi:hypothetical protein
MRKALVCAGAALVLGLAPAVAQAGPFDKYEAVAVKFFGERVDCSASSGVVAIGGPQRNRISYGFHTEGRAVAYAEDCYISVLWPYWQTMSRRARCLVYLHEYAHLLYGDGDHTRGRLWRSVEGRRARRMCS